MICKAKNSIGSVPVLGSHECADCHLTYTNDLYWCDGEIICGDCRYFRRHGAWPCRNDGGSGAMGDAAEAADIRYHGNGTAERKERMYAIRVANAKQGVFLNRCIVEGQLSLD